MRLGRLVEVSHGIAGVRGRKAKVEQLATLLRAAAPDEIPVVVSYLSGELPQGKIGVGFALFQDLAAGEPARESVLELRAVHACFDELAGMSGAGSAGRRREALGALFASATTDERQFLARLVVGELRQGALDGLMLEAIALAADLLPADVRRAAMLAGSVREVGAAAMSEGAAGLARFVLTLFRPVLPMLASPAGDAEAALERLGEAVFELKLDGFRVQVHKDGDEVRAYSRSLHDVTDRVPELVAQVRALPARSLILDGEAIALRADGSPHDFQTTMRRFGKKKVNLSLSTFFFDCLYMDGQSLLHAPTHARHATLRGLVGEAAMPRRLVTSDLELAEAFYASAISSGHEGVMAKSLDSTYEAGSRGFSWLKIKPAHTLDLVVLAVERGSGRRTGSLSNLHLGARGPDGELVMLGKTFKGMTDAMLAWQTEKLRALAVEDDGWVVRVRPELVVEVAFNDVQDSPHYPGGLALRFARVKRYREDKRAADADTIETVRAIRERGHRR